MFWKLSSDPDIHRVQLPPAPQSHPNNVKTAVLWAVFLGTLLLYEFLYHFY